MEKEPSPFNPGAQMDHFLRRMGLGYNERGMFWYTRGHEPVQWTQEELQRWWAEAVPAIDLYPFGIPKGG